MKSLIVLFSLISSLALAGASSPIIWGPGSTAKNIASGGLTLNGTTFVNAPGSYLNFDTGPLTALASNQMIGLGKTVRATKFENAASMAAAFTCTVNPTFTIYDCGTSVASGCTSGNTAMGSVTLTAATTEVDATMTVNNIAAGHYWAVLITAGTCTVLNVAGSIEAGMQ